MQYQIHPIEYYKFRNSNAKLEIKCLSDNYGVDVRYPYIPYVETLLYSSTILDFQNEIIQNITRGKELVDIVKNEYQPSKYYSDYKSVLQWEIASGIKQNHISDEKREFWKCLFERK